MRTSARYPRWNFKGLQRRAQYAVDIVQVEPFYHVKVAHCGEEQEGIFFF